MLFVAEKLAALEVVRRRLDDAGLGMFCLEVHSHKTKKGALLTDLAQRCKMRGSFREPRGLDRHLSVVNEKKQLLTDYAALVNKTIEPFKATIFEILWARDRCGQGVARHRASLSHVMLPVVVQFTRMQFTQAEHFLSVYAQHLAAVLAPCNAIDRHPWAWIARPLQFDEEEHLLGLLGEFLGVIGRADECCEHLHEVAGITLTRTQHGLEHAAYALAALPQAGGAVIEDLLAPCQSPETRQKLSEFVGQVQSFRRNPRIFPGYFSVCADGHGFGYGKHVPLARRSSVDGRCFGWADGCREGELGLRSRLSARRRKPPPRDPAARCGKKQRTSRLHGTGRRQRRTVFPGKKTAVCIW